MGRYTGAVVVKGYILTQCAAVVAQPVGKAGRGGMKQQQIRIQGAGIDENNAGKSCCRVRAGNAKSSILLLLLAMK